jgi:predicted DNA-binding transcriptional regulator AlpA
MRSFSIEQWCEMHGFCRAMFYKLASANVAPRTFKVGRSVRISDEANTEWLRAREAAKNTPVKADVAA